MDRMKTSPEDCDLLLVGGGSIIAPRTLNGVSNIMYIFYTSLGPFSPLPTFSLDYQSTMKSPMP